jgi:hypothetical protein
VCPSKKSVIQFLWIGVLILNLSVFPSILVGKEPLKKAAFNLTIEDDLISLRAKNASIKKIVEEIGRRKGIEIVAKISEKESVSIIFSKLPLEDGLKKIVGGNVAYIYDSKEKGGRVTKIVLLPKGKEESISLPVARTRYKNETDSGKDESSTPSPFKFEFDPSEFLKEGK